VNYLKWPGDKVRIELYNIAMGLFFHIGFAFIPSNPGVVALGRPLMGIVSGAPKKRWNFGKKHAKRKIN
jgi:hypothetical protein